MPIIKHRPELRLKLVPEIFPGREVRARVLAEARHAVEIRSLQCLVEGTESGTIGSGQYSRTRDIAVYRAHAVLTRERTLPAGRSEFAFRFTIPPGSPPSYAGQRAKTRYVATLRACIPWWPDAVQGFELNVGLPDVAVPATGQSLRYSTRPSGPRGHEPHMEVSLASDAIAAGGVLSAAAALANVEHNRYAGITTIIRGYEVVSFGRGKAGDEHEAYRYKSDVSFESVAEAEALPVRVRLPASMPPSAQSMLWRLRWEVEVRARIRWGSDLSIRIPITVLPQRFRRRASRELRAPPSIGSERIRTLWRDVAEAKGMRFDGAALRYAAGGADAEVAREHRGRRGVHLIGSVTYRSLGIGLAIEPAGRFSLASDHRLGDPGFDRRHHVDCRDAEQLAPIAAEIGPTIAIYSRVWMDDERLRIEVRDAGASRGPLLALAEVVVSVARAIAGARARIPLPAPMRDAEAAWRALADNLGGALDAGDVSITGAVHGLAASVRTEWSPDGAPLRTVLEVASPMTIDARYRVSDEPGSDVSQPRALPRDAGALLGRVTDGAVGFEVGEDRIAAVLPPADDPQPLGGRLRDMARLARLLSGAGPYR